MAPKKKAAKAASTKRLTTPVKSKRISINPEENILLKALRTNDFESYANALEKLGHSVTVQPQDDGKVRVGETYLSVTNEELELIKQLRDKQRFHSPTSVESKINDMEIKRHRKPPHTEDDESKTMAPAPIINQMIFRLRNVNAGLSSAVDRLSFAAKKLHQDNEGNELLAIVPNFVAPICKMHEISNLLEEAQAHETSLKNIAFHLEKIV